MRGEKTKQTLLILLGLVDMPFSKNTVEAK